MKESILETIKNMLGILEPDNEETPFDIEILIHINTAITQLYQLGLPEFVVEDTNQTWNNYLGDDKGMEWVKTYIYLKVRLIFDPPTSSFVVDAMERTIKELEWRINVNAEKGEVE